jgi:tetratricopeptide (TPR) repeat protein
MLAGMALTLWTHREAHINSPPMSVIGRLGLIAPTVVAHARQSLLPAHLSMFYPVDTPSTPVAILALGALLALLAAAWRWRQRLPELLLALLWFGIALAPVVRGIRFDEQSSHPDRYSYLPAIGLSLAFASLYLAASRFRRGRMTAALLSGLLVVACAFRTATYLPLWRGPETMGPVLLRQVPDNPLVNNMMGKWLAAQGRPGDAIPHFQKAKWWNVQATCNLVTALLHAGQPADALPIAIELCGHPKAPPDAFLALGIAYLQLDRAADAIAPLQRAAELMPGHLLPWQMLYRAHVEAGQLAAADDALRALRNLDAFDVQDFDGLTRLYVRTWRAGDARLAWPFFANNLPRRPDDILLHNSAAWLLATTENPPAPPAEAVRLARLALAAAGEDHPSLLDTLAAAHAANGDFKAASQAAAKALAAQDSTAPLHTDIRKRLAFYHQHKPYRESTGAMIPARNAPP